MIELQGYSNVSEMFRQEKRAEKAEPFSFRLLVSDFKKRVATGVPTRYWEGGVRSYSEDPISGKSINCDCMDLL